jgi:hypothetical protein
MKNSNLIFFKFFSSLCLNYTYSRQLTIVTGSRTNRLHRTLEMQGIKLKLKYIINEEAVFWDVSRVALLITDVSEERMPPLSG